MPEVSTMEQFNNLIEFRQATYEHGFTKAGDAQFELVDSLLGRPIRSFPELSLLPTFRRQWHSSYAAIERGRNVSIILRQLQRDISVERFCPI
jgi:hypothetical protein